VPRTWLEGRLIGEATLDGRFVDIGNTASLATLRTALAASAIHHGLDEIDAATIRLRAPRGFTQQVSRYVYEEGSFAGIRYRSRLGDDVLNWAIFEPAPDGQVPLVATASAAIPADDPDLRAARSSGLVSPSADAGLRLPSASLRVPLIFEQEAEEALERGDGARLARRRGTPDRLVGEEAAQVQRPHLAYRDESLALEERDAGADVALVSRARERREPSLDAAVVEEVRELLAHFTSFRQAEGRCSETRGDAPAYRPATENPRKRGVFLYALQPGKSS
jgi:hypothetical protein